MVLSRLSPRNNSDTVDRLFLVHPLVTALGFVPITPAGAGFQELGTVGIFINIIGVAVGPETAFALLSRGLLIFEDLIGVP
jgi:hypothetical protein